MSHESGVLKLYRSDGSARRKKVGSLDMCGNGCLMVGDIRVPFPDCCLHSGTGNVEPSLLHLEV